MKVWVVIPGDSKQDPIPIGVASTDTNAAKMAEVVKDSWYLPFDVDDGIAEFDKDWSVWRVVFHHNGVMDPPVVAKGVWVEGRNLHYVQSQSGQSRVLTIWVWAPNAATAMRFAEASRDEAIKKGIWFDARTEVVGQGSTGTDG